MEYKTVILNKISSVVKNLNLPREIKISNEIKSESGSILAVKVINANTNYNNLETDSGRMLATLFQGDIIPVALGNRNAARGMCGVVPNSLRVGDRIEILNIAGVAGNCIDYNPSIGEPVRAIVLGSILDKNQKPMNLNQYDNLLDKSTEFKCKIPLITVIGTGMDAGKTTIGMQIVQMLSSMGKKISIAKLTGVAALRDVCKMLDCGGNEGLSFLDAGLSSTCIDDKQLVVKSAKRVINTLCNSESKPDFLFIELGDGLYGKYGVKNILSDKEINPAIKLVIICANDIPGAIKLYEDCLKIGIKPDVLSGPVTDTIASLDIIKEHIKIETFNAIKNRSVDAIVKILSKL